MAIPTSHWYQQSIEGFTFESPFVFDAGRDAIGDIPEAMRPLIKSARIYLSKRAPSDPVIGIDVATYLEGIVEESTDPKAAFVARVNSVARILNDPKPDYTIRSVKPGVKAVTYHKGEYDYEMVAFVRANRFWSIDILYHTQHTQTAQRILRSVRLTE